MGRQDVITGATAVKSRGTGVWVSLKSAAADGPAPPVRQGHRASATGISDIVALLNAAEAVPSRKRGRHKKRILQKARNAVSLSERVELA